MNKVLLFVSVFFLLGSCKESLPPIDFGKPGTELLSHECFVLEEAKIPSPDKRGVLVEDLTGVRCVACPNAAAVAKGIKEDFEDENIVILGLYTQGPRSLTSPQKGFEDLRTSTAQLIGENIYNFSNVLPAGGVNRKVFNGETSLNIPYSTWRNKVDSVVGDESIVNLSINKTEKDDSTFFFDCKAVFTSKPIYVPFITLLLLENGIKHPQYYSGGTDDDYIHNHIVRAEITPYNGVPLFNSDCENIVRGSSVEMEWQVQIPSNMNLENSSIVALVNYNEEDNKEVIQCIEVKLK